MPLRCLAVCLPACLGQVKNDWSGHNNIINWLLSLPSSPTRFIQLQKPYADVVMHVGRDMPHFFQANTITMTESHNTTLSGQARCDRVSERVVLVGVVFETSSYRIDEIEILDRCTIKTWPRKQSQHNRAGRGVWDTIECASETFMIETLKWNYDDTFLLEPACCWLLESPGISWSSRFPATVARKYSTLSSCSMRVEFCLFRHHQANFKSKSAKMRRMICE